MDGNTDLTRILRELENVIGLQIRDRCQVEWENSGSSQSRPSQPSRKMLVIDMGTIQNKEQVLESARVVGYGKLGAMGISIQPLLTIYEAKTR